jgi:signal transduction histidine kinase
MLATANTAPAAFEVGDRVPLEAFGDLADLMQGRPFLVADIGDLAHITPKVDVLLDRGIRSYISLPMRVRGELVGTLNLGAAAPAEFTEENTDLACQVADSLAIAVQNAWLFDRTQAARKRLQKLTHHLVEAQEQERHRLARELHDEIGQALTAIKISLQTAQRRADMSAANPQLEESIAIVDRALQQLRDVSLDLRPSLLDDLGLVATLRWYLNRHTQSGELRTSLQVEPPDLHLPSALEVIVFRVVQEALTNVMRHARAQNVEVKLQLDAEAVELTVRDDGVSFDLQDALDSAMAGTSMGLLGMQERVALAGGHIDIVSAPGRGTEIRVRFPVAP